MDDVQECNDDVAKTMSAMQTCLEKLAAQTSGEYKISISKTGGEVLIRNRPIFTFDNLEELVQKTVEYETRLKRRKEIHAQISRLEAELQIIQDDVESL